MPSTMPFLFAALGTRMSHHFTSAPRTLPPLIHLLSANTSAKESCRVAMSAPKLVTVEATASVKFRLLILFRHVDTHGRRCALKTRILFVVILESVTVLRCVATSPNRSAGLSMAVGRGQSDANFRVGRNLSAVTPAVCSARMTAPGPHAHLA